MLWQHPISNICQQYIHSNRSTHSNPEHFLLIRQLCKLVFCLTLLKPYCFGDLTVFDYNLPSRMLVVSGGTFIGHSQVLGTHNSQAETGLEPTAMLRANSSAAHLLIERSDLHLQWHINGNTPCSHLKAITIRHTSIYFGAPITSLTSQSRSTYVTQQCKALDSLNQTRCYYIHLFLEDKGGWGDRGETKRDRKGKRGWRG